MLRAELLELVERIRAAADILEAGSPVAISVARHQLRRDLELLYTLESPC